MGFASIRVIVADDHPALLLGLRHTLAETSTLQLVGEARNSTQLIALLDSTPCEVLVTDYAMPGGEYGDGVALLALLSRRYPDLKLVVLTMLDNPALLNALLACGVKGLVSKSDNPRHLISAIHAAHSGGRYSSPTLAQALQAEALRGGAAGNSPALSQREVEVVRLFVSGLTINEIAARLHRSKQTVSAQKVSAMKKLGLQREADLYRYAIEVGLLPSSSTSLPE